jgi:iron(III) transport system substrate-binding protein
MRQKRFTRRAVLKHSSAVLATTIFASPVKSAAPEPTAITPALLEAARKEGG